MKADGKTSNKRWHCLHSLRVMELLYMLEEDHSVDAIKSLILLWWYLHMQNTIHLCCHCQVMLCVYTYILWFFLLSRCQSFKDRNHGGKKQNCSVLSGAAFQYAAIVAGQLIHIMKPVPPVWTISNITQGCLWYMQGWSVAVLLESTSHKQHVYPHLWACGY